MDTEKVCEGVYKLIELKTGKTRQEVMALEKVASKDEPAFLKCGRPGMEQEIGMLLNQIVSVKDKKQALQKRQQQYATELNLESLLTLCINTISFVVPAFALSFLPERIRGTTKDLFITTFLTVLADGLKDRVASSIAIPASALNAATLATGWNVHTAYRFLKKKLFSRG